MIIPTTVTATITGTMTIPTKGLIRLLFLPLPLLLFFTGGCVRYTPSPVVEEEVLAQFAERSLSAPGLLDFAKRVTDQSLAEEFSFDPLDGLSLAEAEIALLYLSPELAVERARYGITEAVKSTAGRLDDPVISLEASRLLENAPSAANPWDTRVGLGFVLPVSGRLGVEKELAAAGAMEAKAQYLLKQQEMLQNFRRLWLEYSEVAESRTLLNSYLDDLREINSLADRLAEQDVIPRAEARLLRIEHLEREAERQLLDSRYIVMRGQLLHSMGVSASTEVELLPTLESPGISDINERDVIEWHPELAMMRNKHAVAEQAFRLEVRRQYPDLTVGPYGAEDDGNWRLGLGVSLPIALWNRNARGLAEAEAIRDAARAEYEAALLTHFAEMDQLRMEVDASEDRLRFLGEDILPVVAEQIKDTRRLAELGIVDVLLIREALSMNYEIRRRLLTSIRESAELRWTLSGYLAPSSEIPTIENESDE